MRELVVTPIAGLPEIGAGDDLGALIAGAVELAAGDVVVVAQKVVSKAEGRVLDLAAVEPRPEAVEIAGAGEDPRFVEVVLREAVRIVRRRGSLLICETRHGLVCASAGVDRSNAPGDDRVVLLPLDPDASAARIRASLPDGVGGDRLRLVRPAVPAGHRRRRDRRGGVPAAWTTGSGRRTTAAGRSRARWCTSRTSWRRSPTT